MTHDQQQAVRTAATWAAVLVDLCNHGSEGRPDKARLANIASALASRFDVSAFHRESAVYVAERCSYFPSFALMVEKINEWRASVSQSQPRLAAPTDGLAEMDRSWVKFYRDHLPTKTTEAGRDRLGSLIRQMSPAAWAIISPPEPREDATPAQARRMAARAVADIAQNKPAGFYGGSGNSGQKPDQAAPALVVKPYPPELLAAQRAANPIVQAALKARGQ